MKKLFSILLVLAIVLSMIPMSVFANDAEPAADAPAALEPAPADAVPATEPAPAAAEQTDVQPAETEPKTEQPAPADAAASENKPEETKAEETKAEEPSEEKTEQVDAQAEDASFSVEGHADHCACGNADLGICTTHTCETITDWTALSQSNQSTYFKAVNLAAGTYNLVLTEDIEVTAQLNVGENCTLNLCLNGHTILVKGTKRAFNVYQAGTLNIADCVGTGKIVTEGASASGVLIYSGGSGRTEPREINLFGGEFTTLAASTSSPAITMTQGYTTVNMFDKVKFTNFYNTTTKTGNSDLGSVIAMHTNTNSFNMYGGTISNCKTIGSAGTIYVAGKATANMYGGLIENCESESNDGGAVYVASGKFNMEGGTIRGCKALKYGGAICAYSSSTAAVNVENATIENCSSQIAGAIAIRQKSSFTMFNSTITGCETIDGTVSGNGNAGAILIDANSVTSSVENSEIKNCSGKNGAGISHLGGTLNLKDVTFDGNTATGNGGGICIQASACVVTMENCTFTNNTANIGGGIYNSNATSVTFDGTVTNNTATASAGGIYAGSTALTVNGKAVIKDNKQGTDDSNLMIAAKVGFENLDTNCDIHVSVVGTGEFSDSVISQSELSYFTSDDTNYDVTLSDNSKPQIVMPAHAHCICGAADCTIHGNAGIVWTALSQSSVNLLQKVHSDGVDRYYYLEEDITITNNVQIGNKNNVGKLHLCLNGHKITVKYRRMFDIRNGIATVCDCKGTGSIESCHTEQPNAGCIVMWLNNTYSNPGATFELYGGTLTYADNAQYTASHGFVYGTNGGIFNMYGGTIDGKNRPGTPTSDGACAGGLTMDGESHFNMYGGRIVNCIGSYNSETGKGGNGGAVSILKGNLYMDGGVIENNQAALAGAGIWISANAQSATVTGSAKIRGNTLTSGEANNLMLAAGKKVEFGTLSDDAQIGLSMQAPGVISNTAISEDDLAHITSDDPSLTISRSAAGKPQISMPPVEGHAHCACAGADLGSYTGHTCEVIDAWMALDQSSQKQYFTGSEISDVYNLVLMEDIEVEAQLSLGENCVVNLCLNGHTILVKGTKRAFNIYQGATLNICDCVGTGKIVTEGASASGVFLYSGGAGKTEPRTVNLFGGEFTTLAEETSSPAITMSQGYTTVNMFGNAKFSDFYNTTTKNGNNDLGAVIAMGTSTNTFNMYGGTISNCGSSNSAGAIYVAGNATANMYGGLIENATSKKSGGAVYVASGRFNVYGGTIQNCYSPTSGGAIFIAGKATGMSIQGGEFKNNQAGEYGGAIATAAPLTITDGIFEGNSAGIRGGAVQANGSAKQLIVTGGVFTGNIAYDTKESLRGQGGGGGAINANCKVYVTGGDFVGNIAKNHGGGAIEVNTAGLVVTGGTFRNNICETNLPYNSAGGGAIYHDGGYYTTDKYQECVIRNVTFEGNEALMSYGGAVMTRHVKAVLDNVRFVGNKAKHGGAYACGRFAYNDFKNVSVIDNEASGYSAVLIQGNCYFYMEYGEFIGNHGHNGGGGLCLLNVASAHIKDGLFVNNDSDTSGGGLYVASNTPCTIEKITMYNNKCGNNGGALYSTKELTIKNFDIHDNWCGKGGGGISTAGASTLIMQDGKLYKNETPGNGGGLSAAGFVEISDCVIEDNLSEKNGGGISNSGAVGYYTVTKLLEGTIIRNNEAKKNGGAMYTYRSANLTEVDGAEIYGNTAEENGGGFYQASEAWFHMYSGTIRNNGCEGDGGAIYGQGTVDLIGGSIFGNRAKGTAGAVFLSNEDSDEESFQLNVFTFGPIKIGGNKAGNVSECYLTDTAAALMYESVLTGGADFTVTIGGGRNITKTLHGAYNYRALGGDTYHITDASNALRPSEVDAYGKVHIIGDYEEVVANSSRISETDINGRIRQEEADDTDDQAAVEELRPDSQLGDTGADTSISVFSAGALGASLTAAAILFSHSWISK